MNNKTEEILIHILLLIFTAGIGNIIYIICKKNKNNTKYVVNFEKKKFDNKKEFLDKYHYDDKYKEIVDKNLYLVGIRNNDEIDKQIKLDILNFEYRDINTKICKLHEKEWDNKFYSNAINYGNIYNEYSDKYIKLCEEYLSLLPQKVEYDKKYKKITGFGNINSCDKLLKQYILLLDKQQNYIKEREVINYLIGLGITDDETRDGLKVQSEKLSSKIK